MIFLNIWNAEALESPCAALSAGCTAEYRGAVECGLAEEGMHTTICSWYEPIVVRVHITTRS